MQCVFYLQLEVKKKQAKNTTAGEHRFCTAKALHCLFPGHVFEETVFFKRKEEVYSVNIQFMCIC